MNNNFQALGEQFADRFSSLSAPSFDEDERCEELRGEWPEWSDEMIVAAVQESMRIELDEMIRGFLSDRGIDEAWMDEAVEVVKENFENTRP